MAFLEVVATLGALAWLPHVLKWAIDRFARPKIRIIAERTAQIGYTSFGPILNLGIAFSVRRRDIVISSIKVRLKHESGEERILSWQGIVQMLGQMNAPKVGPIPWEKESSVLAIKLTEKEIEERLIRFQEDDYHAKKGNYESHIAKKMTYLKKNGEYAPDKILKSEEMKDLSTFINQWFNWKQGQYTLTFQMESPQKFDLENNVYEFSLNPLNIELLESNKDLIPLSYEDLFKSGIQGYQPQVTTWNWVNPILKKT